MKLWHAKLLKFNSVTSFKRLTWWKLGASFSDRCFRLEKTSFFFTNAFRNWQELWLYEFHFAKLFQASSKELFHWWNASKILFSNNWSFFNHFEKIKMYNKNFWKSFRNMWIKSVLSKKSCKKTCFSGFWLKSYWMQSCTIFTRFVFQITCCSDHWKWWGALYSGLF